MKVWPAPGRRVRNPADGRPLTRRGAEVPDTAYWRRRLAAGDVLDADPGPAARPAPPRRSRRPTQPPKPSTRKDA